MVERPCVRWAGRAEEGDKRSFERCGDMHGARVVGDKAVTDTKQCHELSERGLCCEVDDVVGELFGK